jgi:hypothetical protein
MDRVPSFSPRAVAVALAMALLGLALAAGPACDLPQRPIVVLDAADVSSAGDAPVVPQGRELGEPCSAADPCRPGLVCDDGVCRPGGASPANTPCVLAAECGDQLHCSFLGVCAPSGPGGVGDPCATAADCQKGLWCEVIGFGGRCQEAGGSATGAACQDNGDCQAGLACVNGACAAGNLIFNADLFFAGVACTPDAQVGGPFRVFFEIPRGGALSEFYRLPMPNDIRMSGGRVDLTGFPTPGPGPIGVDLVERLVAAVAADVTGWSPNPSVLFRFSAAMAMGTITNSTAPDGTPPSLYLVDIDPASPGYAERIPVGWAAGARDGSRRKYHCQNWLAARPAWERPLAGGRTYAVVVTTAVESETGETITQDRDFATLLASTAPGDPTLKRAWTAYQPLRNWIASEGVDPASIAAAAVFTTQDARAPASGLRPAVRAAAAPVVSDLTLCAPGVTSPCDDGLSGDAHVRRCGGTNPAFHELHGRVRLPIFQRGAAPYLSPQDGGALARGADGRLEVVRYEEVCLALTIPKGSAAPAGGWPLAIYAHGTGGTFRSHVTDGTAEALADLDTGDGTRLGVAVLGIDQVAHGERRGATDHTPEELFFNAFNPAGSRGNALQGAADQHALVRLAETLTVPAAASPTGEELRFDAAKVVYVGHSQGGTVGVPFLAHEPGLDAAVLSGTGGGLVLSLLAKTSPQDVKAGIGAAIQDDDLGEHHPVLNLLQLYFDGVDALNYAERLFYDAPEEQRGKHVLQTYGAGDTWTPPASMRALASAMRITLARPVVDKVAGVNEADLPLEGSDDATWWTHNEPVMAVMVQARPAGYDGHFVLFEDAGIRKQVRHFVATYLTAGLPAVTPRD